MEMIDSNKLDKALIYLDRIANGNNPVSNLPAEEDSVLNNPNVIRCMFFVKEVLQEVKQNGYKIGGKVSNKDKKEYPFDVLNQYQYYEDTTITKMLLQVNQLIDTNIHKKIPLKPITEWLVENGYLMEMLDEKIGKKYKRATEKGQQVGMRNENRNVNGKDYVAVVYDQQAQEFIVNNLKDMLLGEDK